MLNGILKTRSKAEFSEKIVDTIINQNNFIHEMQKERGLSSGVLVGGDNKNLLEQRKKVDAMLDKLENKSEIVLELNNIRSGIDQKNGNDLINRITKILRKEVITINGYSDKLVPSLADDLKSIIIVGEIKESFGILRATLNGVFTKKSISKEDYNKVVALNSVINKFTQDFDEYAIQSAATNPNHHYITAGEYADPFNKGAYVNKLDFVILAALEVDVHFNCNVVVGSNGVVSGAQGGHPDTAAGAKCTIVITPILQGRIPSVCTDVTTVTTPGEDVDVVITDYGIAINPKRQDLIDALKDSGLPLKSIEELRDIAYAMTGEPEHVQFGDRVVGIIEARDGSIMDVVREIKPFQFAD